MYKPFRAILAHIGLVKRVSLGRYLTRLSHCHRCIEQKKVLRVRTCSICKCIVCLKVILPEEECPVGFWTKVVGWKERQHGV